MTLGILLVSWDIVYIYDLFLLSLLNLLLDKTKLVCVCVYTFVKIERFGNKDVTTIWFHTISKSFSRILSAVHSKHGFRFFKRLFFRTEIQRKWNLEITVSCLQIHCHIYKWFQFIFSGKKLPIFQRKKKTEIMMIIIGNTLFRITPVLLSDMRTKGQTLLPNQHYLICYLNSNVRRS